MLKLIIFDLDGTTVNTLDSLAYTGNEVMRQMGLKQMPTENFRVYVGNGLRKMFERLLVDAGDPGARRLDEAMSLANEVFKEGCTYNVKSYPGMRRTLRALKEYGVALAICTNKPMEAAKKVVYSVYGKEMFDYIIGADSRFPLKPDPAVVLHAAEAMGATTEECVYVGDSDVDMKTGKAAGMYTVGVSWGFDTASMLREYEPDRIIDHAEELLNIQL